MSLTCKKSDSSEFRNLPDSGKHFILDLLQTSSRTTIEHANTTAHSDSQDLAWKRWQSFLDKAKMGQDVFLDSFQTITKWQLGRCFVESIRQGSFGEGRHRNALVNKGKKLILGRTIRKAISSVATIFRSNGRHSPFHEESNSNKLAPHIHKLIQAYDNQDPSQDREEAITPHHLRKIKQHIRELKHQTKLYHKHIPELLIGAFFFAMRSCEYSTVDTQGRTKRLTIGDICFLDRKHKIIHQSDSKLLKKASYVTITFQNQKNGNKNTKRTHGKTDDKILCPVRAWAIIIQRIREKRTKSSTPVNFVWDDVKDEATYFKQNDIIQILRHSAKLWEKKLPYTHDCIGSHSLRSGAAMALFLANADTLDIMILGRWSSDAFLLYIRPYIQETTAELGKRMIINESYHNTKNSTQRNKTYTSNRHKRDAARQSDPRKATSTSRKKKEVNNGNNNRNINFPKLHIV